jgi:hypothetical protein
MKNLYIFLIAILSMLSGCGGGGGGSATTTINTTTKAYIPTDINDTIAVRFLNKATFGASKTDIAKLKNLGVEGWLDKQFSIPKIKDIYLSKMITLAKQCNPISYSSSVDEYLADNDTVFNKNIGSFHSPRYRMSAWFDIALNSKDQLRHKTAYALSQIIVESDFEPIFTRRAEALARYFDILYKNSFDSYKTLLEEMSFNSGMSLYLTFNGNKKLYQNKAKISVYPDENYAREIMQLFSIGLNKLNLDGTPQKDKDGNLIPTYTQNDVNELARVFTGWDIKRNNRYGLIGFRRGDLTHSVEFTKKYHDFGSKHLLGDEIEKNLSGEEDIKRAIDIIMKQKSVAPYICKNLIMRLTKSNPSPQYIKRVSTVFKDTNGDLKSTIKAIFLDKELWDDLTSGTNIKFKEPLLAYTQFLRALKAQPFPSWYFCKYGGPTDDNATNCQKVKNSFLFNDTRSFLNQGAGLAPNVFNFYDNSYIANDKAFQNKNLITPELQIQSDTILINFNNTIYSDLQHWEKGYLLETYYKDTNNTWHKYSTIDEITTHSPSMHNIPIFYVGSNKMLLNAQDEYDILEMVIDGDKDGDFKNLKDYREKDYHDDEKALKALIEFEDIKLTGGLLSDDEKKIIYDSLKDKIYNKYENYDLADTQKSWHPRSKKYQLYRNLIVPIIRAIVTSDTYMVE